MYISLCGLLLWWIFINWFYRFYWSRWIYWSFWAARFYWLLYSSPLFLSVNLFFALLCYYFLFLRFLLLNSGLFLSFWIFFSWSIWGLLILECKFYFGCILWFFFIRFDIRRYLSNRCSFFLFLIGSSLFFLPKHFRCCYS